MPNATLVDIQATEPWNKFKHIVAKDGSFGFGLAAGEDFEFEGIWYTVIDAEARTVKTKDGSTVSDEEKIPGNNHVGALAIPSTVTYEGVEYTVTEIGFCGFANNYELTSVTLPASITKVAQDGFFRCEAMTDATFADSDYGVTIGQGTFYRCNALENVTLPTTLESMDMDAFRLSTNISTVNYGASTPITADESCFDQLTYLEAVLNMPNATLADIQATVPWNKFLHIVANDGSVGFINAGDDFEYDGIKYTITDVEAKTVKTKDGISNGISEGIPANEVAGDLVIPSTITYEGDEYTVTEIGHTSFQYNHELTSVVLPNTITTISWDGFYGCSALKLFEMQEGVTSIGHGAFFHCESLDSITLPESVSVIEYSAFEGCDSLVTFTYNVEMPISIDREIFDGNIYRNTILQMPNATLASVQATEPWNRFGHIVAKDGSIAPPLAYGEDFEFEGIWYTVTNSVDMTVKTKDGNWNDGDTYAGNNVEGDVVIPSIVSDGINDYTVEEIGQYSFWKNTGMTSISIPETVKYCDTSAFDECTSLTKAQFASLEALCNIIFRSTPSNPLYYAHHLYFGEEEVTEIVFPESMTEVKSFTFAGGSYLTSITLHDGMTTIGSSAFYGCTGLTAFIIPESVTSIKAVAFGDCTGLTSIYLPESITVIEELAFDGCSGLTSITLPSGLTSIEMQTFKGCTGLTSVEIPESVTTIGRNAFIECSGLTSIIIPAGVTSIGNYAFYMCNSLTSVTYNASTPVSAEENIFTSDYEIVFKQATLNMPNATLESVQATLPWNKFQHIQAKDGSIGFELAAGEDFEYDGIWYTVLDAEAKTCSTRAQQYDSELGDYVAGNQCMGNVEIPAKVSAGQNEYSVVEIGNRSFWKNELTSVVIPEGVTAIRISAFDQCESLTTVHLPETLTSIENTAFQVCLELTDINWPSSLKSIGAGAFNYCHLQTINLPEGLEELGKWAFQENPAVSVTVPTTLVTTEDAPFNSCIEIVDVNYSAEDPVALTETLFPEIVYRNATLNTPNASLESVQTTVPWNKFLHITASDGSVKPELGVGEDFEFEGLIYTVVDSVAKTCKTKEGTWDGGQLYLGGNTFEGDLVIPAKVSDGANDYSVVGIGTYGFASRNSLTSVTIPESMTSISQGAFYECVGLKTVTLHNSLITIDDYAFRGCTGLTEITFPESITSLGRDAFLDCSSLTEIVIPESVRDLGFQVFAGCSSLKKIDLPSLLTSIGNNAFLGSDPNVEVTYRVSVTPIEASLNIFSSDVYVNGTLNMPNAPLSHIKFVVPWNRFLRINASDGSIAPVADGDDFEYEGLTYTVISVEDKTCRTKAGALVDDHYVAGNTVRGAIEVPLSVYNGNDLYSVVEIGTYGFANCTELTSISIPPTVTEIPESAFNGCSGLYTAVLPESVTLINVNAFMGCSSLTGFGLPENITSIGHGAFTNCSNLNFIVIPESLTALPNQVFSGCSALRTIDLPATLTAVEYGAFFGCDPNVEVTYKAEAPIEADEDVFSPDAYSNGTLKTPNAALESVQSTMPWNKFLRITASDGMVVPFASEITLNRDAAELKVGESFTLEATVKPDYATDKTVTWTSNNEEVATVDSEGKVTAIALGEATVTATSGEVTATCKVTVVPTPVESITLSADTLDLKKGETVTLTATVAPDDATDKTVTWTSDNEEIATVDSEGKVTAIALGEATITASNGEVTATCKVTVIPTMVESITLSTDTLDLKKGEIATLTATVAPEDATDKTVTWTSDNEEVATVDSNGKVTAIALGEATITATNGEVTATCKVTVVPTPVESITLSTDSLDLKKGETAALTVIVAPEDATDKTITWTTDNEEVATVDSKGNVTAVALGEATITASCGEVTATCKVTVVPTPLESITLSVDTLDLKKGETATLTATVAPEDATDKTMTWTSDNEEVATVDAEGKVTAVALGEATITASNGEVTATCKVTVVPTPVESITLSNTSLNIVEGDKATLTATVTPDDTTDKTVTWTSSDASVATVSANGQVTAVKTGTATITAATSNGKAATCTVTVTAKIIDATDLTLSHTSVELKVGETVTLEATVIPEDATDKTVTWTSDNEEVATVDAEGKVTAISLGEATITASNGEVTATCKVTVVPIPVESITLSVDTLDLKKGETATLTATVAPEDATDKTVTWTSDNEEVASVDSEGKVTAVALGEATITASCGPVSATCNVTVVPTPVESITLSNASLNIVEGDKATLTATVTPDDATDKTVTWTSSDASVATVSTNGEVTALKAGTAIITASSSNGKTATCTVRVAAKIIDATGLTLSQSTAELKVGENVTLEATVIPENTTDNTVTWISDNTSVAIVDSNGKVTAISLGEASITASCGNVTAICKVTVVQTPVESVTLSETSLNLIEGDTATLTAIVTPDDATDKTVTWTSSDASIATVSANGEVTAVKAGTTTITATSANGKTATCTVTVATKIIDATDLTLSRNSAELKVGETVTLEAKVIPDNATDKTVMWSSSDTSVATVDTNGKVTAISLGEATITAICGEVTATCEVSVVPTPVERITLIATSLDLIAGETAALTATVTPEDATDKTITWTSDNDEVASVSESGEVMAVKAGTATIMATSTNGKTATCTVTVAKRTGDFEYEGLWFTIIDDDAKTCRTKAGRFADGNYTPGNNHGGDLTIPATASDGVYEYSVVEIGRYGFANVTGLTSVSIPDAVISIMEGAFYSCPALKTVDIPGSLKSLGSMVFTGCDSNVAVTYRATTPIEATEEAFDSNAYKNGTLNTPNATLASVQATNPWRLFFNINASDGSISVPRSGEDLEIGGIVYTVVDDEDNTLRTKEGNNGTAGNNAEGNFVIPGTVTAFDRDYTVTEIGDYAFRGNPDLLSVTIPATVNNIGTGAFSDCERLTSLVWQGNTRLPNGVVEGIGNPNLLVYVNDVIYAPEGLDHNIVVGGVCDNLVLTPGYPFTPLHTFTAKHSEITKEFTQLTPIDGCAGWETLAIPFEPTDITAYDGRALVPFAGLSDIDAQCPFWLYEADAEGEWKDASAIRQGVPYLVSMPDNDTYDEQYRIHGAVTFSTDIETVIAPETTAPYITTWASGREFRSLWLPLDAADAADAMGLNVGIDDLTNDEGELLQPGSAFHVDVLPLPLEAYVTNIDGRRAMPVLGDRSFIKMISDGTGLSIAVDLGNITLSSDCDRPVDVVTMDGVLLRRAHVKAGVAYKIENLTRGIYIVAGHKITVR